MTDERREDIAVGLGWQAAVDHALRPPAPEPETIHEAHVGLAALYEDRCDEARCYHLRLHELYGEALCAICHPRPLPWRRRFAVWWYVHRPHLHLGPCPRD